MSDWWWRDHILEYVDSALAELADRRDELAAGNGKPIVWDFGVHWRDGESVAYVGIFHERTYGPHDAPAVRVVFDERAWNEYDTETTSSRRTWPSRPARARAGAALDAPPDNRGGQLFEAVRAKLGGTGCYLHRDGKLSCLLDLSTQPPPAT